MKLNSNLLPNQCLIDIEKSYAVIINGIVANGWLGHSDCNPYLLNDSQRLELSTREDYLYFSNDIQKSIDNFLNAFNRPSDKFVFIPNVFPIDNKNFIQLTLEELKDYASR